LTDAGCGNAMDHEGRAGIHTCFLVLRLLDNLTSSVDIAPSNFYFPTPFGEVVGIAKPNLSVSVILFNTQYYFSFFVLKEHFFFLRNFRSIL
jgi:hypothetical protein